MESYLVLQISIAQSHTIRNPICLHTTFPVQELNHILLFCLF